MNYLRPELIDRLASEYVLGTLRGLARRRFDALIGAHLPARRAVIWWEQRLANLVVAVPPVQPPASVWMRIERQIAERNALAEPPRRNATPWWQALAASLAVIVIGLTSLITLREPTVEVRAVRPAQLAIIADEAAPLWVINAFPEIQQLQVRALRAITIEPNRAFELWMLPDGGAPPVSLGLLPADGEITLALNAAAAQTLATTSTLAVSVEPAGGSPTGAPTGPVVYTAALVRARG
jgi:anti-sigma-K factor RskA